MLGAFIGGAVSASAVVSRKESTEMALTISHTHDEGTVLHGTTRGDGTYEVMMAVRSCVGHWKWARSLGAWIVHASRNRQPKDYYINYAAKQLREAGFEVEVEVDRSVQDPVEAEAARAQRQQERVEALEAKAQRREREAEAAEAAQKRAYQSLPEFGEPIKVGHHSEKRHRRAIEKAWNTLGKSVEANRDAEQAAQRAETASRTTDRRYNPVTVANRIQKLEAELRSDQRLLDGGKRGRAPYITIHEPLPAGEYRNRVIARMEQCAADIQYWKGVRADQIANGETRGYSKGDIAKGDYIRYRHGSWHKVVRVNQKSVTVESLYIEGCTGTVPYHEIREHRTAREMTATREGAQA
ncbi:DUF3560 domain-containing protein [Nocardia cyriacigeorgica]|uniref:DUF3560 domain-containing protein n=1 Tax=Nocardia cyriacigeorgica TaxID=135487 RepID=UPI001894AB61|nr:DUF3560 domain-containing protein [Nocardia cyriacigeorgica]MBF6085196.1 DUF3560 domain-containing protein [Nocardia cyriacigeorgica]